MSPELFVTDRVITMIKIYKYNLKYYYYILCFYEQLNVNVISTKYSLSKVYIIKRDHVAVAERQSGETETERGEKCGSGWNLVKFAWRISLCDPRNDLLSKFNNPTSILRIQILGKTCHKFSCSGMTLNAMELKLILRMRWLV